MVSLAVLYTPYFYINSKEKYLYLISKYKNFIPLAISLAFLGIFFYSFLWKEMISYQYIYFALFDTCISDYYKI
jgi:hypothetical protein